MDPMEHLIQALEGFRKEAWEALDPDIRKAALEDAAEVAIVIGVIENGLNRNKFGNAYLETFAKDE